MNDEREDIFENPVAPAAEVLRNPTAMGATGAAIGLGGEAAVLWNDRKPVNLKRCVVIGTCAAAAGFIGSSLLNMASKGSIKENIDWSERIQNESKDDANLANIR